MALSELENQVYSHHVVTENGFERIVPAELDPHMKGRAFTLLEAQAIISALTGHNPEEVEAPDMFQPIVEAAPTTATKAISLEEYRANRPSATIQQIMMNAREDIESSAVPASVIQPSFGSDSQPESRAA